MKHIPSTMKWNSFEEHLLASQKQLYYTKQFSDVTLVSDDMVEFFAHKTILAAASPMFKTLLAMSSQQQSPFLYLKGIKQDILEDILKYIYLGETEISEQNIQEFTELAGDLGIRELENHHERYDINSLGVHQLKVEKLDFLSTVNEVSSASFMMPQENENNVGETYIQNNSLKKNLGFLNDAHSGSNFDPATSASYHEESSELMPFENYQGESLIQDNALKTDLDVSNDIASISNNFEELTSTITSYSDEPAEEVPVESDGTIGNEEYNDEEQSSENYETLSEHNLEESETIVKKRGRKRKQVAKPRAKEEPADCEICNTHYTTKRSYRRHYMSAHELIHHSCDECGKTYTQPDSLRLHKNRDHGHGVDIPCTKCDRVFKHESLLRKHFVDKHSIKCDFHNQKFLTNEEMRKHIQEEHVKKYCT